MEKDWKIFKGVRHPHDGIEDLGIPPNWRKFDGEIIDYKPPQENSFQYRFGDQDIAMQFSGEILQVINAALHLRRPLFITGKPGCGKSSLAYAVAHELKLGKVLKWSITSRSTLSQGLYSYDAIARLHAINIANKLNEKNDAEKEMDDFSITKFLRLGPLGTAFLPTKYPRVLLIDEIDKSDLDFPNDLLNIFEDGEFFIPEIARFAKKKDKVKVLTADSDEPVTLSFENQNPGYVKCNAFPFIIMTSNEEKVFPPAFLRRCLRLKMQSPQEKEVLKNIVKSHFSPEQLKDFEIIIDNFIKTKTSNEILNKHLTTDQLLNLIYLNANGVNELKDPKDLLLPLLLNPLTDE